ncbi:prepilin-type N-terminal cleavage/methylation domain-containing protein [Psychrobacillus sp. OK028]|uniref:PulJ/GspJ family protein n=1 Tax=Psychrobacillus sp. OK028 TaxID=1884359 RepID=UPI00087FA60F|nr:prepilin-type N-terminal cleavage/methylation domain-containing protein [Psychrobacillus sp. OK028]SDM79807.1 prepilin-type N-terminal cleavage/methylation domain-containing protein [Psychrobacillus sp. OK028]
MKWKFNQSGLTLVELLASLAIFGVISVLMWNFFFQGLNNNERAITQNQLQQEANLIVNTIQEIHTKYTITEFSTTSSLAIKGKKLDEKGQEIYVVETFNKDQIEYGISVTIIKPSGETFKNSFKNPVTEFDLSLTLTSKKDANVKYQTKTTFSKLASNN